MNLLGFENVTELISLLRDGGKWWNYHDVSNLIQYLRFNQSEKIPFYDSVDERLSWLDPVFPQKIIDIQREVQDFREKEKLEFQMKKEMIVINEGMSQEEKTKAKAEKSKIDDCWKFRANRNGKKEAEDVLKALPENLMTIPKELKDSPSNSNLSLFENSL